MKTHPFDPVSMIFGLLFVAIGLAHLSGAVDVATLMSTFWPAALVLVGLALLFAPRRSS